MKTTLYQMKENLTSLGQTLQHTNDEIADKAANPATSKEDLDKLQEKRDDYKNRYDLLNQQIGLKEKQDDAKKPNFKKTLDPKEKQKSAYAQLIRNTMTDQPISSEILDVLGDDETAKTGGQNLLPVTIGTQIISEPFETNPLRQDETITSITNLELPRMAFTIDDDNFVNDQETAKELSEKSDMVEFGRNKVKIKVPISETILNGTDTNLVQYTDNALQSGLAMKEKKVSFATTPKSGEEHMSFYSTGVNGTNIAKVDGKTLYEAIINATADIPDGFQDNIKIYMTRKDYFGMIKELANGSTDLFGKKPEEVLGYPVRFTELATQPIVGNFTYAQLNYEINSTLYEQWKDYDRGINCFGLTAYFDHQILLSSAFRIANVTGNGAGSDAGTTPSNPSK